MKCPFCKHDDTQVVDSRVSEEGDSIRRRRRCPACDKRFTTYERIEDTVQAQVNTFSVGIDYWRRWHNRPR